MKHVLLSRQREFRADRGGATLARARGMIGVLERLKAAHNAPLPASPLAAFGINGSVARGLKRCS
jgi:heat shock protein HtpX